MVQGLLAVRWLCHAEKMTVKVSICQGGWIFVTVFYDHSYFVFISPHDNMTIWQCFMPVYFRTDGQFGSIIKLVKKIRLPYQRRSKKAWPYPKFSLPRRVKYLENIIVFLWWSYYTPTFSVRFLMLDLMSNTFSQAQLFACREGAAESTQPHSSITLNFRNVAGSCTRALTVKSLQRFQQ